MILEGRRDAGWVVRGGEGCDLTVLGFDGVDVEILQISRRTHCERVSFLSVRTTRSSILESPRSF